MTKVSQQDPNVNAFTDPNQNPFTSGGGSFGDKNKTGGAAGVGPTAEAEGEESESTMLGRLLGGEENTPSGSVRASGSITLNNDPLAAAEKNKEDAAVRKEQFFVDFTRVDEETGEKLSFAELQDDNTIMNPETAAMQSEADLMDPAADLLALSDQDLTADMLAFADETSISSSSTLEGEEGISGLFSSSGGSSGSSSNSGSSTA